jgi:hypothetical protein
MSPGRPRLGVADGTVRQEVGIYASEEVEGDHGTEIAAAMHLHATQLNATPEVHFVGLLY